MGILDQLFSGGGQGAGGGLFSGGLLGKMGSNQPPTPQNALLDKMGLGNDFSSRMRNMSLGLAMGSNPNESIGNALAMMNRGGSSQGGMFGSGKNGFLSLMGKQGQPTPPQTMNQGYFPPAPQQQLPLQQFLQSLIK